VIGLERFGGQRPLVEQALSACEKSLSRLVGKQVVVSLAESLEQPTLARMLELEQQVFGIEDNVYGAEDIRECVESEDAFLLLLHIGERLEGYAFGFAEDPQQPAVEGTDYFVDTALVSLEYENLGIGSRMAGLVFLIIYLMGYRQVGVTTESRDRTGRELVGFYRKLGFADGSTRLAGNYAMKIVLTHDLLESFLKPELDVELPRIAAADNCGSEENP
jgi:ribosomal protein S18 acetylase RimI-like enzyme